MSLVLYFFAYTLLYVAIRRWRFQRNNDDEGIHSLEPQQEREPYQSSLEGLGLHGEERRGKYLVYEKKDTLSNESSCVSGSGKVPKPN